MKTNVIGAVASTLALSAVVTAGDWVTYANETSVRIVTNDSSVGASDNQEKDFAWGDVDQDGDTDLVIVRKQPFTNGTIARRNVLFMNEGIADGQAFDGVLVDRTTDYISGFMTATNDRDVVLADVNGDGWLDIVTATTLGGLANPKSITHPRVYINLGNDGGGNWQGFVYDDVDRIPTFPFEPRFCGVAAGDIDNDNDMDLYFVDYDQGPYGRGGDLDDRLLINDGNGYFSDESSLRMTSAMLSSSFGSAANIYDMNGDGWMDVVKSENGPAKTISNGGGGFFNLLETTYSGAAYHVSVGLLNNDGMYDLVLSDDGVDRYMLNQGNGGDGLANYSTFQFPSSTNGFGSDSYTVDLDNNGDNDVIIADVDVDAPGCTRVTDILRNNGNNPNVTFTADAGNIPSSQLQGVHDVAIIDLNGDTFLDLVIGRCSGTQVWINSPPIGAGFTYPLGLPSELTPDTPTVFQVEVQPIGDTIVADSETLHYSVNDGAFQTSPLVNIGGDLYEATLPGGACGDIFDFYVSVQLSGGLTFTDPPSAPASTFTAIATSDPVTVADDDMEGDVSDWTVVNDPSLTSGAWEQADPNGTFSGGHAIAPNEDASTDGTMAFVTQNGAFDEPVGQSDVDGGPTYLISPVLDLDGGDAFVSYRYWIVSIFGIHDSLTVEVTNDGTNWTVVDVHSDGTIVWEEANFLVGDHVTPTDQVQVRFSVEDSDDSATEAGIDEFQVTGVCLDGCPWDLDSDSNVGITDLLALLAGWGAPYGITDLLDLLAAWGPCP